MNSNKLNYTLMDILKSDKFYQQLTRAANISREESRESAFNVYGDLKRWVVTRASREYETFCLPGGVGSDGWVFQTKGEGMYKPEKENELVNVHFHTPDCSAIPSLGDLRHESEFAWLDNGVVVLNDGYTYIVPTPIIGHSTPEGKITLLFRQMTLDYSSLKPTFSEFVSDMLRKRLSGDSERIDFSDALLPDKAAAILNSTKMYKAGVVKFEDRLTYEKSVEKLSHFSLFGAV
jgi:hypothetical protein